MRLNNGNGNVLLMTLVGLAISGILMMAVMAMINTMNSAIKATMQKLDRAELKNMILTSLAEGVCPIIEPLLLTSTNSGSHSYNLSKIDLSATSGVIVQAGKPLSTSTNGLVIGKIQLLGQISGTQLMGSLAISFVDSPQAMPLAPVTVNISSVTDQPGAAASAIVSCAGVGPGVTGPLPSVGGACDNTPIPQAFSAEAGPVAAARKAALSKACSSLPYPTPADGVFDCTTFFGAGGPGMDQQVIKPAFAGFSSLVSNCQTVTRTYAPTLAGLKSASECLSINSALPNSSTIAINSPPGAYRGGPATPSTYLRCSNGVWMETAYSVPLPETNGNGGF